MDGARILILGATGGIGSALSRQLTAAGARTFLVARGEERLQALSSEIGDAPFRALDVTDPTGPDQAVEAAVDALDGLDGVALCVGSIVLKPIHLTKDAEWEATVALNLTAAFRTTRATCKALRRTGGSLVLFSTAAARMGLPNHEAIAAAKAGVEGLARSAAATYAPRGIRVNVVAPGLVDTPLASRITGNARALAASRAMHPLHRVGTAEEVARVAALLLDPDNGWITGQVIGVDGGLSAAQPQEMR